VLQKLTLIVAASALLVASGCKPPMTEFTSTEYKFKAKFPGKPTEQEQTAVGIKFKMFMTEARNGAYAIGVADMPIPANEPTELVEKRLDGARDGAIKNSNGTLKSSNPIKLAGKYPGREFTASITQPTQGLLRGRIYLVGTRLYQVLVMGKDSYTNSAEASAFLESFQLLE
jgi:hypothetical protein